MKVLNYTLSAICSGALLLSLSCTFSGKAIQEAQGPDLRREKIALVLSKPVTRFPLSKQAGLDPALELYSQAATRSVVLDFYSKRTGSAWIAKTILDASLSRGISPALAFSIAKVESNFRPRVVSHNPGSVDRGLFQLNSRTFHQLSEKEFFDPAVNAKHGLSYLEYCLSYGDDEIVALAVYNAGFPRLAKGLVPASTYAYIDKVLGYKEDLEQSFGNEVVTRWLPRSNI